VAAQKFRMWGQPLTFYAEASGTSPAPGWWGTVNELPRADQSELERQQALWRHPLKRMRPIAWITVGTGFITAVVVFLAYASRTLPGNRAGAGAPLSISVFPYGRYSFASGSVPASCARLAGPNVAAVSVAPSNVKLVIGAAPQVNVKRVLLTVNARRSISATAYARCASALPISGGTRLPGQDIRLPKHGSVVIPFHLAGIFRFNLLPPTGRRSAPEAYTWYITAFASSVAYGSVERQSYNIVTLTPQKRHSRRDRRG